MSRAEEIRWLIESLAIKPVRMKEHAQGGQILFSYETRIGSGYYVFSLALYNNKLDILFTRDGHTAKQNLGRPATREDLAEAREAFSIVKSMLFQILKKHKNEIHTIGFSPSGDKESREKLYQRFAVQIARDLGGRVGVGQYGDIEISLSEKEPDKYSTSQLINKVKGLVSKLSRGFRGYIGSFGVDRGTFAFMVSFKGSSPTRFAFTENSVERAFFNVIPELQGRVSFIEVQHLPDSMDIVIEISGTKGYSNFEERVVGGNPR
jgi:hypothetical protein